MWEQRHLIWECTQYLIIDTNIGIDINPKTLFYQSLIAGATGSGKTNSCANYICAALQMGFSVIIYDHKPDYQHINIPNQDAINILNGNAQIPDDILNNLNSRIIHRHNRASEAQRALEKAADAQISMTKNFGPGEALVDLFGASAVVNARMRLSPFQLTTEELLQQQEEQQAASQSQTQRRTSRSR